MVEVLELDPQDAFDYDCWQALLENEAVFGAEHARCRASFAAIEWLSPTMAGAAARIACRRCNSHLLEQIDAMNLDQRLARFRCRACYAECEMAEVIDQALNALLYPQLFASWTEGAPPPLHLCETCREYTIVAAEDRCAACGGGGSPAACEVCQKVLTRNELRPGPLLCAEHHRQPPPA